MIALLDTIGPAICRASIQAAALAILVVLLVRCCGDRLSPRWRFLLWSVVLARLLFVATSGCVVTGTATDSVTGQPAAIPKVEAARDSKELTDWMLEKGVDLICITHRAADGTETYVLRALGMNVREISPRDLRNLDQIIAGGALPEGRPVGELLLHFDEKTRQLVPNANAAFLFITREGNRGLIETTDRITRTADLTGQAAGSPSGGVGFHKGVQFNLKAIFP